MADPCACAGRVGAGGAARRVEALLQGWDVRAAAAWGVTAGCWWRRETVRGGGGG
jgi:hypothetical protein